MLFKEDSLGCFCNSISLHAHVCSRQSHDLKKKSFIQSIMLYVCNGQYKKLVQYACTKIFHPLTFPETKTSRQTRSKQGWKRMPFKLGMTKHAHTFSKNTLFKQQRENTSSKFNDDRNQIWSALMEVLHKGHYPTGCNSLEHWHTAQGYISLYVYKIN